MSTVAHGAAQRQNHNNHRRNCSINHHPPAGKFSDNADARPSAADDAWAVGDAIVNAGGGRNEWRVLKFLDSEADADGKVDMTRRELKERFGFSPATATRVHRRLKNARLLDWDKILVERDEAGPCFADVAPGYKRVQIVNRYTVLKRRRPPLLKFEQPLVPTYVPEIQEPPPPRPSAPPVVVHTPPTKTNAKKGRSGRAPLKALVQKVRIAQHVTDPAALLTLVGPMAARMPELEGDLAATVAEVFAELRQQPLPILGRAKTPAPPTVDASSVEPDAAPPGEADDSQSSLFTTRPDAAALLAELGELLTRAGHPYRPKTCDGSKAAALLDRHPPAAIVLGFQYFLVCGTFDTLVFGVFCTAANELIEDAPRFWRKRLGPRWRNPCEAAVSALENVDPAPAPDDPPVLDDAETEMRAAEAAAIWKKRRAALVPSPSVAEPPIVATPPPKPFDAAPVMAAVRAKLGSRHVRPQTAHERRRERYSP